MIMKPQERNPIWRRRVLMGLSQEELAKKSGVSEATIWNAENGYYNTSAKTIAKVAGVFEIKPGTMLNEYMEWVNTDE
jgi:transcriptional regulator with XRE-family HTH domain